MVKDKLKKTTLRVGDNQKYIASFFSAPGTKVLASVPQNKECNSKEKASSNIKQVVLSPIGCSANQRENLTSSPDPLYVPETPDSQIREARPLNGASLSLRRSLTARRSLLSPGPGRKPFGQAPLGAQNSPVHSVSVKRPMCGFEGAPKTKHMRTMSAMPCGGPVDVYSLLHDDDLTACLKAINDTSAPLVQHRSSCAGKDADQKFLKAGQTLSQSSSGVRLKMKGKAPLRPIQLNGALSDVLGNRPCSLSGSTFPGITEQKSDAILKRQSDRTLLNCPVTQHDVVKPDGKWEVADMPSPLSSDAGSGPAQQSRDKHGPVGGSESAPSQDELAGDEDFWLDDMMMVNELKEVESDTDKCKAIPDHVILSTGLYNRYWVLDVQEAVGPKGYPEKRLEVTASKSAKPTEMCILRDGWESTMVSAGDIVHLEGQCTSGTWVIDRDSGLLVLMPDVLISSTSIASSIRCMRRAVLGERFKAFDGGSKQMLNGTIVHEVFQKAVEAGDFSPEKLQQLSQDLLLGPSHISEMYRLKLMQEDMKQEVEEYLPHMSDWARDYLHSSPLSGKKQLMLKLPSEGPVYKQEGACSVTVSDFLDIEENIWSPRFGLKGKIDLTAKVRIHRRGRPSLERVMPLELKTGRESNSIEHRSQVILYNLMSLERRSDPEVGFLLYLKTGSMHPIVSSQMDKRELLKLRNVLVHYLGNSLLRGEGKTPSLAPLPAVISDPQACKYCPQMRNCAFYSRAVERRGPGDGPDEPFLELESSHLKEAHLQYFSHWVLLCALEAGATEIKGGQRNIWLQSAQEREIQGGCMGNLRITGEVTSLAGNTYTHHFERQGGERAGTCLSVGDWVVVSGQDSGLIAVARGHVRKVTGTGAGVTCSLDRNLSKFSSEVVFRLDQYDGEGGLYTHLGNLSKLMENATSSERLRKLIVDFQPPRFIESLSSVLPRDAKEKVANILKGLNKPQKQAMKKVLLSKDYTLIVGMPGTGKTTTICSLVRILHACGFSVLVTSYTHSAVDNILLKLKKFRIGFLRLGQAQKVHPDIQPFTEEHLCANGVRTLPELERLYNSELVVGSTCMGVKHCLFSRRRFDFCVVDEASQISQPLCLGPLFYADRFVLVGDHQQLSPIVKSSEARTLGMEESLFKRLECHNNAVVQLNMQYRMNSKIMSLSNMLMYEGKLECGSERTANATLQLPERDAVAQELCLSRPEYLAWIHAALEPQNPVCFLDTVKLPAPETVMKGGISNPTEAILVHSMVSLLLKAGCRAGDIGVIAPYRMQLNAISSLLSDPAFSAVEVNTVDKYQGRDKSVIIVSFVRSHTEGNLGTLLKDCRRLNVAVTRAKHKLLMLGSSPSLRRYAPLNRLLNHLEQERMMSYSFHQLLTRHYQP